MGEMDTWENIVTHENIEKFWIHLKVLSWKLLLNKVFPHKLPLLIFTNDSFPSFSLLEANLMDKQNVWSDWDLCDCSNCGVKSSDSENDPLPLKLIISWMHRSECWDNLLNNYLSCTRPDQGHSWVWVWLELD